MATTTTQNGTESTKGIKPRVSVKGKRKVQSRGRGKKAAEGLATRLYRSGKDAMSSAYDSAADAGMKAGRSLPKLRTNLHLRDRSQSLYTMMEERPLVMGAVGLGVGIVLAALLPSMGSSRSRRTRR